MIFDQFIMKKFQSRRTGMQQQKTSRHHTRKNEKISSEPFSEFTSQLVFPFDCSFFFHHFSAMFSHILFALAVHNFPPAYRCAFDHDEERASSFIHDREKRLRRFIGEFKLI
jgi:hypothetical protein